MTSMISFDCWARLRPPWFISRCHKYRSVLVIGLDNAGKTSILCHLTNVAEANKGVVDKVETAPTVGVQMVEFLWRNVHWTAWDMSGQGRYRGLWASHGLRVHGVMFVVDVTDVSRVAVAREELYGILTSKGLQRSSGIPIAILANKYDAVTSASSASSAFTPPSEAPRCLLTLDDVCVAMGLDTLQVQRPVRVFATSVLNTEGIQEAMDWLSLHAKKAR